MYLDRVAAFTGGNTDDFCTFHTERSNNEGVDDTQNTMREGATILPILEAIDLVTNLMKGKHVKLQKCYVSFNFLPNDTTGDETADDDEDNDSQNLDLQEIAKIRLL